MGGKCPPSLTSCPFLCVLALGAFAIVTRAACWDSIPVSGSICECWCGRWDGMSLLCPGGVTGHFLLHLLDNECWGARSSRSQHMPGASAYFLVPAWFLLTFIEIFYRVLQLFFNLRWILRSGTQVAAGAGSCWVVRTLCSRVLL